MNDDITNIRHVNRASVDEYCREHNLLLVDCEYYNKLVKAYHKLEELERRTDYPFDPNVPEMGQL